MKFSLVVKISAHILLLLGISSLFSSMCVYTPINILFNNHSIEIIANDSLMLCSFSVTQALSLLLITFSLFLFIIIYIMKSKTKNNKIIFDLAFIDSLTRLFNLNKFSVDCEYILKNNKNSSFAIICFDIDNFKAFNETFGHAFGDKILINIANILRETLTNKHTFARLFNDHFAILYNYNESKENIINLIEDISNRLNTKIINTTSTINLRSSFGIYILKPGESDIKKLLDNASIAKSSVKGLHNAYYKFFDEHTRNILLEELQLEADMRTALFEEQFQVYYQPKYSLSSNKIVGAEALIRWNHPTKGFISPGIFIPLAEKDGLIIEIGQFIFRKVCSDIREWGQKNIPLVPISINISRVEMYQPDLISFVLETIDEFHIDIDLLEVELTETAALTNLEYTKTILDKFRKLGFKISMDDFGTGYSSLSCLKSIPIDNLKLDIEFIKDIEFDKRSRDIVSSIISLAKSLNLTVIAEGLETKAQVDFLKKLGCDIAQGFYFCKPISKSNFENLFK